MDLERMLSMCRRDQWRIEDLDWSLTPRPLSREHEVAICQYFMDMSAIELMAGKLFEVQRDQTDDPVLREIFDSFIVDEIRHSECAKRLSEHYDVHRYQRYELNPHLVSFRGPFVAAAHHLPPDVASAYITTGELLLDVALLRSLNDFVDDDMSHAAMELINRDESRHIAIDYHMVEYYASERYRSWLATQEPRSLDEKLRAAWSLISILYHAGPFFRDVFFAPMDLTDPSGRRLLQAFKRIQLLGEKPGVADLPFTKFIRTIQDLFNDPLFGSLFGPLLARIMGLDPRVIVQLYTEEEAARAHAMTFQQMAEEALAAKLEN